MGKSLIPIHPHSPFIYYVLFFWGRVYCGPGQSLETMVMHGKALLCMCTLWILGSVHYLLEGGRENLNLAVVPPRS